MSLNARHVTYTMDRAIWYCRHRERRHAVPQVNKIRNMEAGRQAAKPLSPDILNMLSRQLESRNSAKHSQLEEYACAVLRYVFNINQHSPTRDSQVGGG